LRNALIAQGTAAEQQTADTLLALEATVETVGLIAAGVGVVIYEMTTQHFDLEDLFLKLTATTGGIR